jgi:hypothetical protein
MTSLRIYFTEIGIINIILFGDTTVSAWPARYIIYNQIFIFADKKSKTQILQSIAKHDKTEELGGPRSVRSACDRATFAKVGHGIDDQQFIVSSSAVLRKAR